ncbi:MAG TPA: c-type cytochrome [Gemmatimonadaceae bacterium]|jgi:mono/diheme cytochrome c family protein|nr:c-type cytochrome [Gemmatimonadaceae bacterium]
MFDSLGVSVLVLLAVLGVWLAIRSRRAKNRGVKWTGLILSSLLAVVCSLATVVVLIGYYKINFPAYRSSASDVKVAGTPEQIARGAKLAVICSGCHSPDGKLPLAGRNFMDANAPPAGKLYAVNLTPAGEIKEWSDGEVIRAIREGRHKSGRSLIIMPSGAFRNFSDVDVHSVVAYLRSQPAAGQRSPATRLNIVGAALVGAGVPIIAAQPPIAQPVVAPQEGASAEYGRYLVSILACQECHGPELAGRKPGGLGPPAGPNLTALVPSWSAEGFIRTLRTGIDPANHKLLEAMPWKEISSFANDDDLMAIYMYLHSLKTIEGPSK